MNGKDLICKVCKSNDWNISWSWKNDSELYDLALNHDGIGLLFDEANFVCNKCKVKLETDKDD